ncbi:uncharacterized protein LOC143581832 [Bidens hawaiensis]|uniref:uncharacterized protein LOC143581832 n=1 Tax=Bidens hawaiensis TaxID=980011 RepID=UPI00404AF0F0
MDSTNTSGMVEQFIENKKKIDQIMQETAEQEGKIMSAFRAVTNKIVSGSTSSLPRRRRSYINRDHVDANDRLMKYYFNDTPRYNDTKFERRFRMCRHLFLRIAEDLELEYPYFQQKYDARGYLGFSTFQKCTLSLHILACVNTTDINDEYLKMAEKTTRDTLENFCITKI